MSESHQKESMFRAEFWRQGGKIQEITPEKRTLKTVTVNGRRENKTGVYHLTFGQHNWFNYREDAVEWLIYRADDAVARARVKLEASESVAVDVRGMRR